MKVSVLISDCPVCLVPGHVLSVFSVTRKLPSSSGILEEGI